MGIVSTTAAVVGGAGKQRRHVDLSNDHAERGVLHDCHWPCLGSADSKPLPVGRSHMNPVKLLLISAVIVAAVIAVQIVVLASSAQTVIQVRLCGNATAVHVAIKRHGG